MTSDFIVSGYKLVGSVENDSGKHAITGIAIRLVNENGGRSFVLSAMRCL